MLTIEKLEIFRKYNGDIDTWARSASVKEKRIISDDDWYMIESFLEDITMTQRGLVSIEFSSDLNRRMQDNCENKDVITLLESLR